MSDRLRQSIAQLDDTGSAPEQIWWNGPVVESFTSTLKFAGGIKYIRADTHQRDLDRVFDAALEAAIEAVENRCGILADADDLDGYEAGANLCLQDIRALKSDAALRAQIMGAGE